MILNLFKNSIVECVNTYKNSQFYDCTLSSTLKLT